MDENLALKYYDEMVINFKKWQKNGIDKNASHNRFINAAIALAQLNIPNPFNVKTRDNANAVPTAVGQIVTAVKE